MFPEGTPDLQSLLQQASAMQERLVAAQHELEEARVEGSSGGGLVSATVTGTGELIGLTIDPSVLRPGRPGDARGPGAGRRPERRRHRARRAAAAWATSREASEPGSASSGRV